MANNEVWVRWKDSSDDWLFDTVTDLKDDAEIKDLRKAFVRQQNLQGQLSPAEVQVRETTVHGEDRLKASSPLVTYFVPPTGCVPEPGKSEDTALFLTVPRIAARAAAHPPAVYFVGLKIRQAKQSKGARGNVYKLLEQHNGRFSQAEGVLVRYENDDLVATAYFMNDDSASAFQTAINAWEINKELLHLDGIELDPITPKAVPAPRDLQRIRLQDYHPQDFESPCQSLDQLHSYRLSVPVTEPVEPTTDLARYQSIDKPFPHIAHYKCHLKDKAMFKKFQNDENNMVAASWMFHQQLDGLNVPEGIPLVALSVSEVSEDRVADHGNRYRVVLRLTFYYQELATVFAAMNGAQKVANDAWTSVVYVTDKAIFQECIEWKLQDTNKKWAAHKSFLERE